MRNIAVVFTILMVLGLAAMAQDAEVARMRDASTVNILGTRPVSTPFSLLDLSRLKWSHSYSISFMSGGGSSGSVGLLNNSMFYEFSPALSLRVDIGVLHNSGFDNVGNDATLLPGFQLDFHPSEKFSLTIGMARYNSAIAPLYTPAFGYGRYNNMRFPY